jgi:two-component system, NtrC family, response regulator AlgB
VAAMQRGAFDYLEKPFTPEHLRQIIGRVEKQRKLESKIDELQQQISQQNPTIELQTTDSRMAAALDMLYRAAPTQAAILLLGENGTGKSVLAQEVHRRSNSKEGPIVTVSCPSLSRELLESELFATNFWGQVICLPTAGLIGMERMEPSTFDLSQLRYRPSTIDIGPIPIANGT